MAVIQILSHEFLITVKLVSVYFYSFIPISQMGQSILVASNVFWQYQNRPFLLIEIYTFCPNHSTDVFQEEVHLLSEIV